MAAAGLPAAVRTVATVAGGGVAVDGRFARDSGTAEWRPTAAPLDLHPYALAAYRGADGAVRAIVSATSDPTPLPEPFEPDDDGNPPTTMTPAAGTAAARSVTDRRGGAAGDGRRLDRPGPLALPAVGRP